MREQRGRRKRERETKRRKGGGRRTEDDPHLFYYQKGKPQHNREKSNGENEEWNPKKMN